MSSKSVVAPTAADVRAFLRSNPKRVERLSEQAQATLREGARGRLHPEVIASYNKGRKPERQYVLGRGRLAKAEAKQARERAAEAGVEVGKRGPLPKAAKEFLAQPKG